MFQEDLRVEIAPRGRRSDEEKLIGVAEAEAPERDRVQPARNLLHFSIVSSDMPKRLEMAIRTLVPSESDKKGFRDAFCRLGINRLISQFQPLRKKFFIASRPISFFLPFSLTSREKKTKTGKYESMTRCFPLGRN